MGQESECFAGADFTVLRRVTVAKRKERKNVPEGVTGFVR